MFFLLIINNNFDDLEENPNLALASKYLESYSTRKIETSVSPDNRRHMALAGFGLSSLSSPVQDKGKILRTLVLSPPRFIFWEKSTKSSKVKSRWHFPQPTTAQNQTKNGSGRSGPQDSTTQHLITALNKLCGFD